MLSFLNAVSPKDINHCSYHFISTFLFIIHTITIWSLSHNLFLFYIYADIFFWRDLWLTGSVKWSITLKSVLMLFKRNVWCWKRCLPWLKWSEICFISFLEYLFNAIDISAKLFISMVIAGIIISPVEGFRLYISTKSLRSHVTSLAQEEKATYSVSTNKSSTTVWNFDFQISEISWRRNISLSWS